MFIKQLIVQGFKSYKDQTIIDPFSPNHNVIVGRNGSGKSNFFAAIRFVLSDAYTNMSREERQALLHEGTGPTTLSAFVEIIFDNSDHRFPTGKDELVLRRTIGLKKDEYALDRKTVSKSDVMNLLESAGFSRSNPYYIVPQGRVTSLTHAKDHERLQLLKEVAGTRVYENKRQESIKIMDESESKRAKIEDLITYIQERLDELESEKKELNEFHEKDRDRRCLEYALYSGEQRDVTDLLSEMEDQREREVEADSKLQEKYRKKEATISAFEQTVLEIQQSQDLIRAENRQLVEDRQEKIKTQAQIKLAISDLEDSKVNGAQLRVRLETELSNVQKEVASTRQKLAELNPELDQATSSAKELQSELDYKEQQRQILYAKQGRGSQFRSKSERDKWLRNEIKAYQTSLNSEKENLLRLEEDKTSMDQDLTKVSQEMMSIDQALNNQKTEISKITSEVSEEKKKRDHQSEKRKELWREDAKLDASVHNCREELKKMERNLAGTMDMNTTIGISAVKKIAQEQNLKGVYGALYELVEIPELYRVAAETTAGSRLFHVVVDNENTASTLLEALGKRKEGRVTFMPLNRLRSKVPDYSKVPNAIPLINELHFEKKYKKAFEQVFGNTIVCENLGIASNYARSFSFDAITLDGDRVDRRGAMYGGYHDTRMSRLEYVSNIKALRAKLEEETKKSQKIKSQIQTLDQQVTQTLSRIQQLEAEKKKIIAQREPMFVDLSSKQKQETYLMEIVSQKKKLIETLSTGVAKLEARIKSYQDEEKTRFATTLTDQELAQLDQLSSEVEDLRNGLLIRVNARSELETKVSALINKLQSNLERRRIDLSKQLELFYDSDRGDTDQLIGNKKRELKAVTQAIEKLSDTIKKNESSLEEKNGQLEEGRVKINQLRSDQALAAVDFELQQKSFEQYLSRKALLVQKREACAKNIRELGVLPEQAFTKFVDLKAGRIMKLLAKVNTTLKQYSHVNKKAFEQYNKFHQQKETLLVRTKELSDSKQSIQELLEVLDMRKDEAIERTFKQVALYFSQVFERLVPAGKGKLIMQKRSDLTLPENDDGEIPQRTAGGRLDNYVGVSIKVSFNNKTDEGLRMQQLSGGQKSLVALAMIFAIQKCDPAPFYLFDEIDANLDAAHRTAVASMIYELSRDAQFITTTFRPELLANADKFYGVTFTTKVSNVSTITKQDATQFVELEHTA